VSLKHQQIHPIEFTDKIEELKYKVNQYLSVANLIIENFKEITLRTNQLNIKKK
jgi:hypothetical protein